MNNRPILVAELGINHQGNFDTLCAMADMFLFFADYVKTQVRNPRICVPKDQWDKVNKFQQEYQSSQQQQQKSNPLKDIEDVARK